MKKLITIGLLATVIIACALLPRSYASLSQDEDAVLQERLTGVWLRDEENLPPGGWMPLSLRCTNTVAADGSFVEVSWLSHPDRTNTYQDTGTWRIKDGNWIETVTKDSNKAAVAPRVSIGHIVFLKTNEFIISWQGTTNTQTWQKISP